MSFNLSSITTIAALLALAMGAPSCTGDASNPGEQDGAVSPDADNDGGGDGGGEVNDDTVDPDADNDGVEVNADSLEDGEVVDPDSLEPDNSPLPNDAIDWDAEVPAPTAGEPGYPCTDPQDCASGWCIASSQGLVCSETCIEDCSIPGWQCTGVTDDNGNPSFICIDQTTNLCNPCSQNKDCNSGATNAPNLCLDRGSEGSFCGMNCGQAGTACPPGYECADIEGQPNVARFQCVPANDAVCSCNAWGEAESASTTCDVVVAGVGACPGTRSCVAGEGLAACSGQTPVPETCNGIDDNCDGNVDEEVFLGTCEITNSIGTCQGQLACGGNQQDVCVGQTPSEEVCNGVDDDCDGTVDNDFDDFDLDGQADCVDTDDDNDGTLDIDDCEPFNADIGLLAVEACDNIDNNCNGVTDEPGATGCSDYWRDADGDTFGSDAAGPLCLCEANPETFYTVTAGGDCNDVAPSAFPGGTETCNNVDDDCNGTVDDNLPDTTPCFISNAAGTCQGVEQCVGGAVQCVGQTPTDEICNAIDDNCNGDTDEGTPDYDNDGDPNCTDPDDDNDNSLDVDDCQPLNELAFPGAMETCDGTDTNCNGIIDDENATGCTDYYQDADGDNYGSSLVAAKCLCGPDNFTFFNTGTTGDCNDINGAVNPAASETCNFIDDNCDGNTDEGVASPCNDCSSVCVIDTGEDGDDGSFQPEDDNSGGVTTTPEGGITLDSSTFEIPFIWIANSAEDTVSKLNTQTGAEVARYFSCDNPSRTAVDIVGNGIITSRFGSCVFKIAVFESDCIDTNDNGVIDTSRDDNGNGTIEANEMVANDECILWNVTPNGSTTSCDSGSQGCARAAGIDSDGDVWVGFFRSQLVMELDGQTGAVLNSFPVSIRPYGLAIDEDQTVWVVQFGGTLVKVDPELGEVDSWSVPDGGYGMAIDPWGSVWIATEQEGGVVRFNTVTESFDYNSGDLGDGYTRGVAISVLRDGGGNITESKVYVANHEWNAGCGNNESRYVQVINIDPSTQVATAETPIDLGDDKGPVGVALDSDNNLWTVNQCESTATKVNTATKSIIGEYPVGLNPYTYSDMSGYALKTITAPDGYYRQIYTGWPGATTLWDKLIIDATLPGSGTTRLQVRWRTADTEIELSGASWSPFAGPFPPDTFPVDIGITGNVFELELRLITDDPALSPTIHDITVIAYEQ